MKLNDEIFQIITWAENKNLIKGSDAKTETLILIADFGKLSVNINEKANCVQSLGNCMISLIIICRMKNISLYESLECTQDLEDIRVKDPNYVLITMMKYLGGLATNLNSGNDIKPHVGYILIYITVLTKIFNYSLRDCLERSYSKIKKNTDLLFDGKYIKKNDEHFKSVNAMIQYNKLQRKQKTPRMN